MLCVELGLRIEGRAGSRADRFPGLPKDGRTASHQRTTAGVAVMLQCKYGPVKPNGMALGVCCCMDQPNQMVQQLLIEIWTSWTKWDDSRRRRVVSLKVVHVSGVKTTFFL